MPRGRRTHKTYKDWVHANGTKAPPLYHPLRAAYEHSDVFKARQAAAMKGVQTKHMQRLADERKEEDKRRLEYAKADMKEKLGTVIRIYQEGGGDAGGMKDSRDAHEKYYEQKMIYKELLSNTQFEAMLEALDEDVEYEGLDWDILYG